MNQKRTERNYLEYIPVRNEHLTWKTNAGGIVTLNVENTGFFNRFAQKYFRRPRYTHVHLDTLGSFIWPLIDGRRNVMELGNEVEIRFGEEAAPLYERLARFFQVLESYRFIKLHEKL